MEVGAPAPQLPENFLTLLEAARQQLNGVSAQDLQRVMAATSKSSDTGEKDTHWLDWRSRLEAELAEHAGDDEALQRVTDT